MTAPQASMPSPPLSEQRAIVESYLFAHFPEHRVRTLFDGRAWSYTLVGDPDYSVQIDDAFLTDHSPDDVENYFAVWRVADELRGGARRLRITTRGMTVAERRA